MQHVCCSLFLQYLVHLTTCFRQTVTLHAAHGITQRLAVLGQTTQTGKDKYAHVSSLV
jgi:hypothetical protein